MTFLFDPVAAWASLLAMEKGWGGTPAERMAAKYKAYAAQYGTTAPKVEGDAAVNAAEYEANGAEASTETVTTQTEPLPAKNGGSSPAPAAPAEPASPTPIATPAA
jgi:penicillin-binding protein 2